LAANKGHHMVTLKSAAAKSFITSHHGYQCMSYRRSKVPDFCYSHIPCL